MHVCRVCTLCILKISHRTSDTNHLYELGSASRAHDMNVHSRFVLH